MLLPRYVDDGHLDLAWPGGRAVGFPGDDGRFEGEAILEVTLDGAVHAAAPLAVTLDVHAELVPMVSLVDTAGVIYVNEAIEVTGSGFSSAAGKGRRSRSWPAARLASSSRWSRPASTVRT